MPPESTKESVPELKPWTIVADGSVAGVIAKVKASKCPGDKSCQCQIESAKALILAEIKQLPTKFNAVRVTAEGNCNGLARQLNVIIIPTHRDL